MQCGQELALVQGHASGEVPAGFVNAMRYKQSLEDKYHEVQDAKECAVLMASEHDMLVRRMRNCCIAGVVVALLILSLLTSLSTFSYNYLWLAVFMAANYFFIPFGMAPIKDFISRHGFVFLASAAFFAMAFVVLIALAFFIGLPYAIWLACKIKSTATEKDNLYEHASALEAEYRGMQVAA